jgi:hypothetical protein
LDRIEQCLEPLGWLGDDHPLSFLSGFVRENTNMSHGRIAETLGNFEAALARLRRPATLKTLGEDHAQIIYGGMLCGKAFMDAYGFGDGALKNADKAEALGIRMWALGAAQARMLYHALRGESEQVQRYRSDAELLAVQGGATWQLELIMPTALLCADFLAGDTIAVRRDLEHLARRARVVPALAAYADAAQAMYLTSRDQLVEAIALYERILPEFQPFSRQYWSVIEAGFAQALNRSGQHARAKELLTHALAQMTPADLELGCLHLELQRQLALAEAGANDHAKAASMLDELLAQHGAQDNALLIGLLHKARAEVALMTQDVAAFDRHFAALDQRFRRTKNPALVSQTERLLARAVKAGLRSVVESPGTAWPGLRDTGTTAHLSLLDAPGDPFEHALKVVIQRSFAKAGYLYVYEDDRMRLVAANRSEEAPKGLETQLLQQAVRLRFEASDEANSETEAAEDEGTQVLSTSPLASPVNEPLDVKTAFIEAVSEDVVRDSHRVAVLHIRRDGESRIVGGLILEIDPQRALLLPGSLVEAIADALHSRGTAAVTHL